MSNITTISKGVFHDNVVKAIENKGAEREYKICMRTAFDPKRVSVENLGFLLDVAGISVIEAYEGNPCRPRITKEDRAMLSNCQKLSSRDYAHLNELIESMTDAWWKSTELPTTKDRMAEMIRRRTTAEQRHNPSREFFSPHMERIWTERKTKIDLDEMPDVARILDISLHWLLCLPDSNYFFCFSAKAQHFYDEYMLLPESTRAIVRSTISSIADSRQKTSKKEAD